MSILLLVHPQELKQSRVEMPPFPTEVQGLNSPREDWDNYKRTIWKRGHLNQAIRAEGGICLGRHGMGDQER